MKTNFFYLVIVLLISSCSSQVYSPSLNLTTKPLKEKEIDIHGGVEMLPETLPEDIGSNSTLGLNWHLAYGFSDNFNLTVKGWNIVDHLGEGMRHGQSLSAQFIKNTSNQGTIILIPKVGISIADRIISGYGFETAVVYQKKISNNLSWHGGSGVLWGFSTLGKDYNDQNQYRTPMGIGAIGYLGMGWQVSDQFRINAEANPIYQINSFDKISNFIISPTIGLGYTLSNKKNNWPSK